MEETGLSLGYLNRPDLTKDKFIKNPFGEGMIYKTGDLTAFLPDGNINYLGRIDNQIKLRGFRIELSEIDHKILTFAGIKESITIINSNNICSYIVTKKDISLDNLKKYLSKILPTFMVPNFIVKLDSLPLTVNGKVDKRSLPLPSSMSTNREIIPARNGMDKIIVDVLKEILHLENISIKDSFFEIGGDSLIAISLSTHLSDKLNVAVSVKDIFDNPIIENLSDVISNSTSKTEKQAICKTDKKDYYALSSAQKRIYYACSLAKESSTFYNIPMGILLDKIPDIDKLKKAFSMLVNKHESLRTYFEVVNGDIVQKILDNFDFNLNVAKGSYNNLNLYFNDFIKPFDLKSAPLFRAKLINFENNKSLLLLDMHHIISDGASLQIFMKDLCDLYNENTLDNINFTYKDFAVWENENLKNRFI